MFLLNIKDPYIAPAEISSESKEKVHLEAFYFSTVEKVMQSLRPKYLKAPNKN